MPIKSPSSSRTGTLRSQGGGRKHKFTFVSTRMGIRRSNSRHRKRSSSRRRNNSLKRNSSIRVNEDTSSNPRHRARQPSTSYAFGPSNTSDTSIQNFLQKRIPPIRRSKSVKTTGKENRPLGDMTSLVGQGANLRNADVDGTPSLFMPAIESPEDLSLTGDEDAIVRPLHYSILGKEHCFEVITRGQGSRCFSCDSEGEREAWIEKIKRTLNPNLDNSTRVEHHLNLGVQEAKGIPMKKRYFCEICLDRQLYARTTSKLKNDNTVLWGESFDFTSIPDLENITVHLYKDTDKKKKKDKDYMGLVNLSVSSLNNDRADLGKWYTLSTPSGNNKSKTGEQMAIRIKARFQSVRVLQSEVYKPFAEFVSTNYMQICDNFKHILTVSQKDELAKLLVRIMYETGSIKEYMTKLVMHEIEKVEEESLIFRENTIGTKSVEAFLRLVGMTYLNKTLGEFVKTLFDSEEDFEVDESRLPPQALLQQNQENLEMCCKIALHKIVTSIQYFPSEMQEVFTVFRKRCEACNRPRIATRLITASLFLRLLCPAILNPSLFGLAYEMPGPKTSRALTLVAKVIQNLANRSRFGNKEEYMKFMDVFIRDQWDQMGEFIDNISSTSKPTNKPGFDGFIDIGKELAKLHAFFVDLIPNLEQSAFENLDGFKEVIGKISEQLEKPFTEKPSLSQQKLDKIIEDTAKSTSTNILSSTPMAERRPYGGGLPPHSASMMDMHEFQHQAEFSGFQLNGSQSSIPATGSFGSFNNSNNALPTNNYLASTENLPTNPRLLHSQSHQAPLSFANPAYQQRKRQMSPESGSPKQAFNRGLSSPGSLSMTALNDPQTDPTVPRHLDQSASKPNEQKPRSSQPKGPQPLSFHNPLQLYHQSMKPQQQQQHLETVFTTETVTYRTPAPAPAPYMQYTKNVSEKDKAGSDVESSNQSSCVRESSSSRQSSTSDESSVHSGDRNNHLRSSISPPTRSPRKIGSNPLHQTRDEHMVLTATPSNVSISSAHLKTGLQKQTHPTVTSSIDSPRRRSSAQMSKSSIVPTKKLSVGYNMNNNTNKPTKIARLPQPQKKYQPSLQLTSGGQGGAVLSLNGESELVDARPAALPSNARVKATRATSKQHSTPTRPNDKFQHERRRSSHKSIPHSTPGAVPPLHLSTPEDQLTPEERTAQWILNNPTSGVESPTPKSNSQSIDGVPELDQLHREIEKLRALLSEKDHSKEKLGDQLRASQKNEKRLQDKLARLSAEKEKHISDVLERLNHVEHENHDLRSQFEASKSTNSSQRKRISQLEIANARLLRAVNQLRDTPTSSPVQSTPHSVARRQRSRQSNIPVAPIEKRDPPPFVNGDVRVELSSEGSSSV